MNDDSLFEFPSDFPIKAMGRDTPHFKQLVIDLVAVHATFDAEAPGFVTDATITS